MKGKEIVVRDLYKSYKEKVVLDGVNLEVDKGEIIGLIGPSGCGKTTFLKILLGLVKPEKGEIYFQGEKIFPLENGIKKRKLSLKIGMVFQTSALFDFLSVEENVGFYLKEHKVCSEMEIKRKVKRMLEMVSLQGTEDLKVSQLSEGMKKRVALARSMIYNPSVLLYDEPTAGLDVISSRKIIQLISKVHQRMKITSVIATHDINCALSLAKRIVLLRNGEIKDLGQPKTAEEVLKVFIQEGGENNEKV